MKTTFTWIYVSTLLAVVSSVDFRVTRRGQHHVHTGDLYQTLINYTTNQFLMETAESLREKYAKAHPYPHVVIDNLFPPQILKYLVEEIPQVSDKTVSDKLQGKCAPNATRCVGTGKNEYSSESVMGPVTRMTFAFLRSNVFIRFLERLSGIDALIPDPDYFGSGIHVTLPGGKLNVHADFNWQRKYNLQRRVNTFLFVNPDWPESYGGHLELWNKRLDRCAERIAPVLGRFVAFSTTDFSYHGHPHPLPAPIGRARRSLAMYYYRNGGRPTSECLKNDCSSAHSTIYVKPKCECIKCMPS